jgi:predicted GNAT family acetyltransferase
LFALSEDKAIGMIVYVFNDRIKTKHIANIFGVYVKIDYRGKGIGRKLLDQVLLQIQKNKEIVKADRKSSSTGGSQFISEGGFCRCRQNEKGTENRSEVL